MVERKPLLIIGIAVLISAVFFSLAYTGPAGMKGFVVYQGFETNEAGLEIYTFEETVYLTKNIEKTVLLEINNTGERELTDISLELEGVGRIYYLISPSSIDSLDPGETAGFDIKFFFDVSTNETDFSYLVKTSELTKRQPAEMVFLDMGEFFLTELLRLRVAISELKERARGAMADGIGLCEDIIDTLDLYIKMEEFISARENVEEADECIKNLEDALGEGGGPLIEIDYWSFIVIFALIFVLIILIVLVYSFYKKREIIRFLKELKRPHKAQEKEVTETESLLEEETGDLKVEHEAREKAAAKTESLLEKKIKELKKKIKSKK